MFKRRFLHNTLFVISYFAQVYLSNRISYRSAVKCVVKRKKSTFRSYAKLKIEICPQVVPFRKYCHKYIYIYTYIYLSHDDVIHQRHRPGGKSRTNPAVRAGKVTSAPNTSIYGYIN